VRRSQRGRRGRSENPEWQAEGKKYMNYDRVNYQGKAWLCQRGHGCGEGTEPEEGCRFWREVD